MYEFMYHLKRDSQPLKKWELHENFFLPVTSSEINDAEKILDISFPVELAQFYKEVGWGQLQTGNNGKLTDNNYVANPHEIVLMMQGTSDWLMPYSQLQPDTLPFFQRGVDLFLCFHINSENPNAVHWMWGEKICDSLVEFFERLVKDPDWFNPPKT
jgi:antitoxin YxxD